MLFCPNCQSVVTVGATDCAKCGAVFSGGTKPLEGQATVPAAAASVEAPAEASGSQRNPSDILWVIGSAVMLVVCLVGLANRRLVLMNSLGAIYFAFMIVRVAFWGFAKKK